MKKEKNEVLRSLLTHVPEEFFIIYNPIAKTMDRAIFTFNPP